MYRYIHMYTLSVGIQVGETNTESKWDRLKKPYYKKSPIIYQNCHLFSQKSSTFYQRSLIFNQKSPKFYRKRHKFEPQSEWDRAKKDRVQVAKEGLRRRGQERERECARPDLEGSQFGTKHGNFGRACFRHCCWCDCSCCCSCVYWHMNMCMCMYMCVYVYI